VLNTEFFLRPERNEMTDKTNHRDSTDCPHSGPIRQGSVLHRVLEMVAAEIVRKLPASRAVDETANVGSGDENNTKEVDIR
jgi:hypothetical protein